MGLSIVRLGVRGTLRKSVVHLNLLKAGSDEGAQLGLGCP